MELLKLNLQMFADANVQTTQHNAPGNDLSPTMKEFYDTTLLENARADLYFNQFGEGVTLPKNHGNTVEWRRWATFKKAMTPLQEGVTPDGNKLHMTKITQSIDQFGDYTTISDRLELEAVDNVVLGATEEHGAQAGETLDCITRNEVLTGVNVMYAGGKQSRLDLEETDIITPTLVNKAATFLKKMKAPKIDGCYVWIIHPSCAEDLRECDGWIDVHKYSATTEIFNGEIGKLHGIRFVETTEQKVYCGEDLASDARNLKTTNVSGNTVTFNGGTVKANELVGRIVLIANKKYEVTANTTNTMTLVDYLTGANASGIGTGDIYPGEGGKNGMAVYANIVFGKGAWGKIEPTAESMKMIIKSLGSGGTEDPLDQRSTVGWKASHAAKILYEERLLRIECGSTYSTIDEGN